MDTFPVSESPTGRLAAVRAAQPAPCGCLPGTDANGWHEQRCAPCVEDEKRQWAEALREGRRIAFLLSREMQPHRRRR